nr:ABC transporter permease [Terriglobales bacterium]
YTAPITKLQYLGGRFLGALLIQLVIFSSVGLGAWLGTMMPWLDPARVGPNHSLAFFQPYWTLVIPNLIFGSAIFFGLAALSKKMLPVYVGSVILLIGYFVATQYSSNVTVSTPIALADMLGGNAVDRVTQYWSPFERNTRLIPLTGILLWNRLLWLGVAAAVWALTYAKFSFTYTGRRRKAAKLAEPEAALTSTLVLPQSLPVSKPVFSRAGSLLQFFSLTRIQFSETVRNIFFVVLLMAGWGFAVATALGVNSPRQTPVYPLTMLMVQFAGAGFVIFALVIITFYSGELIWRERDAGLDQIMDAMPVQRWVLFTSKLAALMLVQVVLVCVIGVAGMTVQLLSGYHRFEFGLYAKQLFGIYLIRFWILSVLALLVHTVINNKYLGHFVMVLYYIVTFAMGLAGLQHFLYRFGQTPPFVYSDMNKFGPFAAPLFWFELYWGLAALALAVIVNLLWVRGTEVSWRVRWKQAGARLTRPAVASLAVALILFVVTGTYIFYNTNILNTYRTSYQEEEARAQYEKKYRQFLETPQPQIISVNTQIDLYPEKHGAVISGRMMLQNKTNAPIARAALTVWPVDLAPLPIQHIQIEKLAVGDGQITLTEDKELGFYLVRLPEPLAPGAQLPLDFALRYENPGFKNSAVNTDFAENGMLLGDRYLPYVGYAPEIELTDDSVRHKHGLNNVKRLPKLTDVAARRFNAVSRDADWIQFEATVSTSPDQIAIMPGYLQKEWVENGRRYFHYKMDAPILGLYSLNSARYDVRRDRWHDVNLEVYYQPGHEFNIDHMLEGMKLGLDYCTANFSPFQFHQLRIIEFPRYQTFAASYANTIPYSEEIGFITKVDAKKPDAIDLPLYVTAHEVAHQWWAHQVISANVEGETSIVETLAQYSALMVMKKQYGDANIRKFLKTELDAYLRGRAQERNEEMPLETVGENQGYIHYNKGGLVMYAIQDYIGEDKVNQALAQFVKDYAFKGAPYPVSTDLVAYLRKVTPPEYQYLYDDLWENITLYNLRAQSATATKLADGKYRVQLTAVAAKMRADGRGEETPLALHDWIDVGVQDAQGKYLYLQKQKIESANPVISVEVSGVPAKAGLDPLNKLIDRQPDDNVTAITE